MNDPLEREVGRIAKEALGRIEPDIEEPWRHIVGLEGVVTGRTGPKLLGQVCLAVAGGSEEFLAHADTDIPMGTEVRVTRFYPPRTVFVEVKE